MRNYIIKRLLIMIPTFFGITLVVFTIVNFAKASDRLQGQQMGETTETSGESSESLKYFKQEFHLDKPILINTRFTLNNDDIRTLFDSIFEFSFYKDNRDKAENNEIGGKRIRASEIREIREKLVDYGRDILLILWNLEDEFHSESQAIVKKYPDFEKLPANFPAIFKSNEMLQAFTKLKQTKKAESDALAKYVELYNKRQLVNDYLVINSQGIPKAYDSTSRGSDAELQRQKNTIIFKENLFIKNKLATSFGMLEPAIDERIKLWGKWIDRNRAELTKNLLDKIEMFLLDTRFAHFWGRIMNFDFGVSIHTRKRVLPELVSRLQYSLSIAVTSTLLAYLLSIPLGIFSAVKQNSFWDRVLTVILFILYSLPSFFAATVLQYYLATSQGWQSFTGIAGATPPMPLSGFHSEYDLWITMNTIERLKDLLWHLTLPIICMTYASLAMLSRYARSGILDEIRSDYVRTARAKGLSERVVIWKHVVRNGIIPIITLLGQILPVIIGGSVIIEVIFGIDGMGRWMFTSIINNDFNVVMTVSMISAVLTLVGILISDLMYAVVDPRISFD